MASTVSPNLPPHRKLHLPPELWVYVITFGVRLFVLIRLSTSPYFLPEGGDMRFYSDWALRISKGEFTNHLAFYGLPGYPFLIGAIYTAAGYNPFLVGLLQAIAEGLIATLIYKIAVIIFRKSATDTHRAVPAGAVGWIAALGWAFFQPAQAFSTILMPTTWLVLAFWGCVWWVVTNRNHSSVWNPWLGMGLLLGAVAMIVATIMLLLPLVAIAIVLQLDRDRPLTARLPRIAAAMCCLCAGLLMGTGPCWIHNYFIAKDPVFLSAHSGVNFYLGNNPIANGYPRIPPGLRAGQEGMLKDSISMAEAAVGHKLRRSEVSRYWSAKAHDYIHAHFTDWLNLMLVKVRNFWSAFQYDDLSVVNLLSGDGILTPGIRFGVVAALAIPGIILAARASAAAWWIIAAVFLHMAALMPVFVTERYRLAAVPGLLLMAGFGLCECWRHVNESKWRLVGVYVALTCASTLFVGWPQQDKRLWSLDFYELGIKATDARDFDRAQKNLEIAYAYVPENSEINFALGNLWLEKGDRTRSKAFYREAIQINPRHGSAWNNLGVLAMQEKRFQLAEKFFSNSILAEPDSAKTHYLLAKTRLELGDIAGSRASIEQALKLKPKQKEFIALRQEIADRETSR